MSLRDRVNRFRPEPVRTWRDVTPTIMNGYKEKSYRLKPEIISLVEEAATTVTSDYDIPDELCEGLEFLFCIHDNDPPPAYVAWLRVMSRFADGPKELRVLTLFDRDTSKLVECQATDDDRILCFNKDALEPVLY